MKDIKYRYALNEQGIVVSIDKLSKETSKDKKYYCLECKEPLIPRLGEKRAWHFAHMNNETHCSYETYLHKLAKHLIKKKFEESSTFKIKFHGWCKCDKHDTCPLYDDNYCKGREPNSFDLKDHYNTCQEEEKVGNYIADLLLCHSEMPKREPILIEIHVTHKSTEEKKKSGYKIIELTIKSEDDLEYFLNTPTIEDDIQQESKRSANFYGFKTSKTTKCFKENLPQIIISRNETEIKYVGCYKAFEEPDNDDTKITFIGRLEKSDIEKYGYIVTRKKGYDIKTCALCKYYRDGICCPYKKFSTSKHPEHHTARTCKYYRDHIDEIEKLEKTFKESTPHTGEINGYKYYILKQTSQI